MSNLAFLSLGANIEPEKNLPAAVELLAEYGRLAAVSTVWETEPLGSQDAPRYLNAAVLLETRLSAEELRFGAIAAIETRLKRQRSADKFAPRTIDIDIILFNQDIIELGHRHIPDAELLERDFVAIPMAELAPDYVHPENGMSLRQIADRFELDPDKMKPRPDIKLA